MLLAYFNCSYLVIPKPPQDASFRTTEQCLIKAHFFIKGVPLKINTTMSMLCSVAPQGELKGLDTTLLISTIE